MPLVWAMEESLYDKKLKLDEMLEEVDFLMYSDRPYEAYMGLVSAISFAKNRGLAFDSEMKEDYEAKIVSMSIKKSGESFRSARKCAEAGYYIETRDNLARVCNYSNISRIVLYENKEMNKILRRAYKNNINNFVDSVKSSLLVDENNYSMAKFYHDSGIEFLKNNGSELLDILKFEIKTGPLVAMAFFKNFF